MFNRKSLQSLALAGAAALLTLPAPAARAAPPMPRAGIHDEMRRLWEDHIIWTRVYIISAVAGLPDKGAAAQRLLQNQVDIGNAVKGFYGEAAGAKLSALLKDHILIASQLIDAAQAGDKPKMEDAVRRWNANADEIALFLSGANPKNWPAGEMKKMMREHLQSTTAEVMARLQKDWPADVAAYDQVHARILMMADMLSDGIIRQFPEKFRNAH